MRTQRPSTERAVEVASATPSTPFAAATTPSTVDATATMTAGDVAPPE